MFLEETMRSTFLALLLMACLLAACATPTVLPTVAQPEAATATVEVKSPATETPAQPTAEPAATETPTAEPTVSAAGDSSTLMAYVDSNGNVALWDSYSGDGRTITTDGTPVGISQPGQPTLFYYYPAFSSDNQFLAAIREVGTPNETGYSLAYSLWIYDLATGESNDYPVVSPISGMSWRPGTHEIAYTLSIDNNYWNSLAETDPAFATPVVSMNVDTKEVIRLVEPERGLALINPQWAPDGMTVSFEEVKYMEGRGMLAYYDFAANKYVSLEKSYGGYDWSPDGQYIVYDELNYAPSMNERIWEMDRQGQNVVQLSPEPGGVDSYQMMPVYSPDGTQIAYWESTGAEDDMMHMFTLFVISPNGDGEAKELGEFPNVNGLVWTADGEHLLFGAGPMDKRTIIEVSVADGEELVIAPGLFPAAAWPLE
jgi:Tol biopolymer transport system component